MLDLIFDSISIILVFYCKLWAFRIILDYISYFWLFLSENQYTNIHNNIIDISSFQTRHNVFFSSTGFYFESKVIQRSHKGKNMFLKFKALLPKMYIFEVVTFFFSPTGCPVNSVLQWHYIFIRSSFLMKHFSSY